MYGFDWRHKLFRLETLFAFISGLIGGVLFLTSVFYLISFVIQPETFTGKQLGEFLVGLLIVYTVYQFIHLDMNKIPEIRWEHDGFSIQIFDHFLFKWEKIYWNDVIEITSQNKYGLINDLQPTYLIKVARNLSKWHKQFSNIYSDGIHPIILITPSFPEGEGFLNRLQTQIRIPQ
ncbi:MAG TPA: hypothetical protein PK530_11395 [Anaerolineales bacterium]|nr:hypothetical protein [Anaerolineales bacterium]